MKGVCDTVVLACTSPEHGKEIGTGVIPVPQAAYDNEIDKPYGAEDLAKSLLKALRQKWEEGCDVLHVHNPTLARNRKLLKALEILRDKGIRMFLQVHDFAEDGRPDVYNKNGCVADVHYGVINTRDYRVLLKAGLKKEGLHLIFNQVEPLNYNFNYDIHNQNKRPAEHGFVLYPVRAIRRKNIGETLLLSLFLEKKFTIGITLPPTGESDQKSYSQWKRFIHTYNFNVKLGVGINANYPELLKKAPFVITTSVNEGFGFTFLEPWTAGKMVYGRNLPHVCRDFIKQGVDLKHLYNAFLIPVSCICKEAFYKKWRSALIKYSQTFGIPIDLKELQQAFDHLCRKGIIDFGVLDETAQMQALLKIKGNKRYARMIRRINPGLRYFPGANRIHGSSRGVRKKEPGYIHGAPGEIPGLIARNNAIIRKYYGIENYRSRLLRIYHRVKTVPVSHCIHQPTVLKEFFKPEEYKMLKWKSI